MKRSRLLAAVSGVVVLSAALGGSAAYGGSNGPDQASAIKIGALTPLTGSFAPWGIQARAGMALAVNEINRSGGVKGRGNGRLLNLVVADDHHRVGGRPVLERLRRAEHVDAVAEVFLHEHGPGPLERLLEPGGGVRGAGQKHERPRKRTREPRAHLRLLVQCVGRASLRGASGDASAR